ncbi:16S rRNA (guanine(966)-N(2))-methyltransferase RsmD [Candidatus Puniceispirillum sp.]|nr:16S rRNA (guanine(966)-N(2))-methyltransferase RsmD [Candidatus Puniceispirillum sp.]
MRIIAGSRRGAILTKLDAVNTRPTTDRVRESLFNILQGSHFGRLLADCHVIDLFAGTGALGLEAVSRGAAFASFVENNVDALAVLQANIAKLRFQSSTAVLAADALSLSHWRGKPAQLVFADAPYQSGVGLAAVTALARIGALANGAVIVLETGKTETLDITDGSTPAFTMVEARSYGKAMLHFLTYQA